MNPYFRVAILGLGTLPMFLSGCAPESRPDVPSNAMQVASGGKVVAFAAPHDGKAYLNDDTDHRVVYSTDLRRDQVMRFDPVSNTLRIDGNSVPEGIAHAEHEHSIYFVRSMQTDREEVPAKAIIESPNTGVPTVRVPIGIQVDVQTQPSTPK